MRGLTFEGYLRSYVQHLAGQSTLSLSKLTNLAVSEPRLVEPLLLWAVASGRADRLSHLLVGTEDRLEELNALRALARDGELESALAADDSPLPLEYTKVWRSYLVRRDATTRDAQLKLAARKRAFLTQGNVSKLSLDRAYELVRYLDAA